MSVSEEENFLSTKFLETSICAYLMAVILLSFAVYAQHCGCFQKSMLLLCLLLTGTPASCASVSFSVFSLPGLSVWPLPEVVVMLLRFPV